MSKLSDLGLPNLNEVSDSDPEYIDICRHFANVRNLDYIDEHYKEALRRFPKAATIKVLAGVSLQKETARETSAATGIHFTQANIYKGKLRYEGLVQEYSKMERKTVTPETLLTDELAETTAAVYYIAWKTSEQTLRILSDEAARIKRQILSFRTWKNSITQQTPADEQPDPATIYRSYFVDPDSIEVVQTILLSMEWITEGGKWKKPKNRLAILFDVLDTKGIISGVLVHHFCPVAAAMYKTTASDGSSRVPAYDNERQREDRVELLQNL